MAAVQLVVLSALIESLGRVLPDRLQHPESLLLPAKQALIDQRLQRVYAGVAHLLRRLERAAAAEDRQSLEQEPFLFVEEVVAPCDGRAQGLLPRIYAATCLEQVEPPRQAVEQLLRREHGDPGSGELERERQVVEPGAQLVDDRAGLETRVDGLRPRDEEIGRIPSLEWRDGIGLLARKSQQLSARHEELKVPTGGEQPSELVRCIDQVLEVVEHEQEPAVADAVDKAISRFERLSGYLEHELRVAQRSKRGPEDAVGILVGRFRRRLEREPRLAGSGRAGQRHQARDPASEQGRHLAELSMAPQEARRGNREVRLLKASQRRERFAA